MAELVVDNHALELLGQDFEKGKKLLLGRLAERGYQLLRAEVPYETGNLQQGVAAPDVDYERMEATLTVSARSGATGSREAKVYGKDGKEKKTVTLRPSPAYNYADVIARGNKDAVLSPKHAKAFLIPIASAPSGEGYLLVGSQIYIVRKTKIAIKPNPYDQRTADQLKKEAASIADGVLRKFFN